MREDEEITLQLTGKDGRKYAVRAIRVDDGGETRANPDKGGKDKEEYEAVVAFGVLKTCEAALTINAPLCGFTRAELAGLLMGAIFEEDNVSEEIAEHCVLMGRKTFRECKGTGKKE